MRHLLESTGYKEEWHVLKWFLAILLVIKLTRRGRSAAGRPARVRRLRLGPGEAIGTSRAGAEQFPTNSLPRAIIDAAHSGASVDAGAARIVRTRNPGVHLP